MCCYFRLQEIHEFKKRYVVFVWRYKEGLFRCVRFADYVSSENIPDDLLLALLGSTSNGND